MQHQPTHWDIARAANTMAVQSSISIDPTKITPRIKAKLLRWLNNAQLEGGYRSEARKIGELIVNGFQLPVSMTTWNGLRVRVSNKEMVAELTDLMTADFAAYKLENPGTGSYSYWTIRYNSTIESLNNATSEDSIFIYVHNQSMLPQFSQVFKKHMQPEDKAAIQRAIDAINGTELIPCFTITN